ncbi:hypothetical protein K0B74_23715, partial [Salmonella enterica subsp. enterica serovar Mbandaka]|nr:hypothetical protein [Salmonella enterica subsp. enterica serovar Mbandaka]
FIEPDVPVSLNGDPMRLQQVISNLLSNAIKFTDIGCIVLHVRRIQIPTGAEATILRLNCSCSSRR